MTEREALGPAEHIIQSAIGYRDHLVHNRPGIVRQGTWFPATWKQEGDDKVVYELQQLGRRKTQTRVGILHADDTVRTTGRANAAKVCRWQPAGLLPEVATELYGKVCEVYAMDNEFVAHWASYAHTQDHRDMKAILCAFMLVQARKGDHIEDELFDDDFRDVGEAMILIHTKDSNPKMLLRIGDILRMPEVAEKNRKMGFSQSRQPFLGRWPKAVEKYLRHRENNPQLLEGLVRAGFRRQVIELAQRIRYKPTSAKFYETLRWKQKQSADGRREIAIGDAVKAAETWAGLDEYGICQRIEATKPNWKRIVGLLPKEIGLTQAIVTAAVENGCLSDKDLIILTPTLEELGLTKDGLVADHWAAALKSAEDLRARNIARTVKSKDTVEALEAAADTAAAKAVEEVMKDMRVYVLVDISASMHGALPKAKEIISKFLGAFPAERLHIAVFNTVGREVTLKAHTKAGVEQAFRSFHAGGGTSHRAGMEKLVKYKPEDNEDTLIVVVGDEGDHGFGAFADVASQVRPSAFAVVPCVDGGWGRSDCVRQAAARLQVPCFDVDTETFDDPYAIPRTLRNLIQATPVGHVATGRWATTPRKSLVDTILDTELLKKPTWAVAA